MRSILLLAALLPSLPQAAVADGRAELRAKCQADVKANCGLVLSQSKGLQCLIDNAPKLSTGCRTALEKASCSDEAPANLKAAFACSP
ncbi:hypothetical protein [Rhizobium sp.]